MDKFDVAIVGAGISGAFAAVKIAKEHKNIKTLLIELGRPPQKRRSQMNGWLGLFPSSDGKLFLNDVAAVAELTGTRKAKAAERWVNSCMSEIMDLDVVKDKSPSINLEKRIKKNGFNIKLNNYIQLYPKEIHSLSKYISNIIYNSKNISMNFDNEVLNITKEKKSFIITTSEKQVECKRIIICTGRSGWRWTSQLYNSFGIIENNDIARFGVRVEASSSVMKDFNKSNCSITKNDLNLGPFCWNGTVIPEDHVDFITSSFRSNEQRWKSDKVSFNLTKECFFKDKGFEQASRIGQLTFVLSNDRITKERISTIMAKKSRVSIIPEYDWLPDALTDVGNFIPDILTKGYFHIPTILPLIPKINIGNNLATEVDGMFCAGEASGITGILAAATTGLIGADSACK